MLKRQPGGVYSAVMGRHVYWRYYCHRGHRPFQRNFPYTEEGRRAALAVAAEHRAEAHGEEQPVEPDIQAALAGLEARFQQNSSDLLAAESENMTRLRSVRAEQGETLRLLTELKQAVADQFPPFRAGQCVIVKSRRAPFTVEAVGREFGMWIVLGHFPADATRQYLYPSSALE